MVKVDASLMTGTRLLDEVILSRMLKARRDLWIATANLKAMLVPFQGAFVPVVDVLAQLARDGVEVRLLHADKPSRPFLEAWRKVAARTGNRLTLRVCPRVHFKMVLVDGAWAYVGSANLTGAGLGAKDEHRRNFELGLGMEDPDVLDQLTALFVSIWDGAQCGPCKLYDVCPSPLGPRNTPQRRKRAKRDPGLITLGKARRLPRAMDR